MPAIEVSHLSKEFRLGTIGGLKQTLLNAGARITGRDVPERPIFKALDDVNFAIDQGEVVGIIGHNGAGKSTLLKILARISNPTEGSVKVKGRIAPLIEVGAGFVPDFTGRENVYLNGAILGMSRKEIDRKFDEIVEFAEMAEFIDTPVKRYSSGMQVKLAFSVASSIESEVLIVDEVLAVGDLAFQRKCYDRVEQYVRQKDRTILLVSHNLRQVERLCTRVLLLDRGAISSDGDPTDVCNLFFEKSNRRIAATRDKAIGRYEGSPEFELLSIQLIKEDATLDHIQTSDDVVIEVRFLLKRDLRDLRFTIGIHTTDLFFIGVTSTDKSLCLGLVQAGEYAVRCQLAKLPLAPGVYALHLGVETGSASSPLFRADNILALQVDALATSTASATERLGVLSLAANWEKPKRIK